MTKILTIENAYLSYEYNSGSRGSRGQAAGRRTAGRRAAVQVFANLHLTLHQQQWIALIGQSGIGKTSLLRMIAGLLTEEEKKFAQIKLSFHHDPMPSISYMPQQDCLLPWLTVLQNTLLITRLRYYSRKEKLCHKKKALALLDEVGLAHTTHLFPHQLSGGMRQRVALIRTLMEDKTIILMDEPFSALDAITRFKLQDLAAILLKDKTVLFITHDPLEALRLADDIYLLAGNPATLRNVAHLSSKRPRSMTDPALTSLHASLFSELTSEHS